MVVALRMPYPLDPETAQAVDAAIEHHVIPWEVLEEGDEIDGWLINHYIAQGKTDLPDGAYRLQHDYAGSASAPDSADVRKLFADQESFDEFLAGENYSYGLADVTIRAATRGRACPTRSGAVAIPGLRAATIRSWISSTSVWRSRNRGWRRVAA